MRQKCVSSLWVSIQGHMIKQFWVGESRFCVIFFHLILDLLEISWQKLIAQKSDFTVKIVRLQSPELKPKCSTPIFVSQNIHFNTQSKIYHPKHPTIGCYVRIWSDLKIPSVLLIKIMSGFEVYLKYLLMASPIG